MRHIPLLALTPGTGLWSSSALTVGPSGTTLVPTDPHCPGHWASPHAGLKASKNAMLMSHQLRITQITGLPGEPGAFARNMPPSVGCRETPEEGVRERGLDVQARAVGRQPGRPGETEPEKRARTRRQPALGGGWDTWVCPRNRARAASGLPLLSVPDLPGALSMGTHLLEHQPQK